MDVNTQLKFKIYVIFHKTLYRECYSDISQEDFKKNITCMAVNGKIQKTVDSWFKDSIMCERDLINYNPFLQLNNFCEASVYYHLFNNLNTCVDPYDFIGCIHYDMKIKKSTLDFIQTTIDSATNPSELLFYFDIHVANPHLGSTISYINTPEINECIGYPGWITILQMYNTIYNKNHTIESVAWGKIPLFHTFILHKSMFIKIMPFIEYVVPRMLEYLHYETHHLPYHIERLFGIVLLLKQLEGELPTWHKLPDVIHEEGIKDKWQDSMNKDKKLQQVIKNIINNNFPNLKV